MKQAKVEESNTSLIRYLFQFFIFIFSRGGHSTGCFIWRQDCFTNKQQTLGPKLILLVRNQKTVIQATTSLLVDLHFVDIIQLTQSKYEWWHVMFPRERSALFSRYLISWVIFFHVMSQTDRGKETLLWCLCFSNSLHQLLMSYYCSSCQKVAFTSQACQWLLTRLWKDGCEAFKPGLLALWVTGSLLTFTGGLFYPDGVFWKLLIRFLFLFSNMRRNPILVFLFLLI